MSRPDNLGYLEPFEFKELEAIAERFARACSSSTFAVRIEDYLPEGPERFRLGVLCELIKIDLAQRWQRQEHPLLEEYLTRFPELKLSQDLSRLVFEEYRVRKLQGHRPSLDEYKRRFPTQYTTFKQIVQKEKFDGRDELTSNDDSDSKSNQSMRIFDAGAVLDKRYTLKKKIGEGTFGQVWKAEEPDGELVAIKIPFKPLDQRETANEMKSLARVTTLEHEFLLHTRKFWAEAGYLFIVMELADCTLKDRLKWHKERGQSGIPVDELLPYFQGTAAALDYLHSKDMVHRDVKPHNILLVGGRAKLADFGLTRQLRPDESMAKTEGGTIAYMPPEMFEGKAYKASDQYCFAIAYAEMRQGRLPFRGSMAEMLKRENPDLESLELRERDVLLKALDKDPYQRYASCVELVTELGQSVRFGSDFSPSRINSRVLVPVVLDLVDSPSVNGPEQHQRTHVISIGDMQLVRSDRSTMDRPMGRDTDRGTFGTPTVEPERSGSASAVDSSQQSAGIPWPTAVAEQPAVVQRSKVWTTFCVGLLLAAGLLVAWNLLHHGVVNEVHGLVQNGDSESLAKALAIIDSSWLLPPSSQEWRDEVEKQWWSALDTEPSDPALADLRSRHADLQAFCRAFPEHTASAARLKTSEKILADKVRLVMKQGDHMAAAEAIKKTVWSSDSIPRELRCELADLKQADEIGNFISSSDFAGALNRLMALNWCDAHVQQTLRDKIAAGWLAKIGKEESADTLPALTTRQQELLSFREVFPEHKEVEPGLAKHEATFAGQVEKELRGGTIAFAEALAAARSFSDVKVAQDVVNKVETAWWFKLDLVDGKAHDLKMLTALQDDLAQFKLHFPDKKGIDARQTAISSAIQAIVADNNLLATAEEQRKNGLFVESLISASRVKAAGEAKNRLRAQAEDSLAEAMEAFSRGKEYKEIGEQLAKLDESGIVLAHEKLKNSLNRYRLEVAWVPFLTGEVDTARSRAALKKIYEASLNNDEAANFRALNGLADAYDAPTNIEKLVDLANLKNPPTGYRNNMLMALARFEKAKNVLTLDQLFKLGQAAKDSDKAGWREILAVTPQRLIDAGYVPSGPLEWRELQRLCEIVEKSNGPVIRQLAERLIARSPTKLGPAGYAVLMSYVQMLQAEEDRDLLFKTYGDFLDMVDKKDRDNDKFLKDVLEPGVKLGRVVVKNTPAEGPRLARLLVAMGWARGDLSDVDLKDVAKVKEWSDEAIKLSPKYAGGFALAGAALLQQARRDLDKTAFPFLTGLDQITAYKRAIEALDMALKFAPTHDAPRASIHLDRSMATLELGTALKLNSFPTRESTACFLDALQHADLALELFARNSDDAASAWQAKGNAHENLAQSAKLEDKEMEFKLALEAFGRAESSTRSRVSAMIAQGRCLYSRALAQPTKRQEFLLEADKLLKSAVTNAAKPIQRVEVLIGLAKVEYELGVDPKAVLQLLDDAIKIEKQEKVCYFAELEAAAIAFTQARYTQNSKEPANIGKARPWLEMSERYLRSAAYRDCSFVADYRHALVKLHFQLQAAADNADKGKKRNTVAEVFGNYSIGKTPGGFEAPVLLEEMNCYLKPGFEDFPKAVDLGRQVARLAGRLADKSAKYPKEREYWRNLEYEALAETALGFLKLSVKNDDSAENKKQYIFDALAQAEKCFELEEKMRKEGVALKDSNAWKPFFAQGYAYYALYFEHGQDLTHRESAIEAFRKAKDSVAKHDKFTTKKIDSLLQDLMK
jgi:serine/threonine protein kinase